MNDTAIPPVQPGEPTGTIRKVYRSMQDIVFETLRDEVLSGKLRPGEALNTLSLSNRLGVSRTPIREALNRLVSIGLIETFAYRGAFVRKLSAEEVLEVYYIRAALAGVLRPLGDPPHHRSTEGPPRRAVR